MKDYKAPRLADSLLCRRICRIFRICHDRICGTDTEHQKGMFNDYDMMLFDKVIAYDHLTQKISVIVNMKTDRVMENYGKAAADIQNIINIIRTAPAPEIQFLLQK